MARSTCVYTVHHSLPLTGTTALLGAFTVKHEMVTAVSRWIRENGGDVSRIRIFRNADGRLHLPDDITAQFAWNTQ